MYMFKCSTRFNYSRFNWLFSSKEMLDCKSVTSTTQMSFHDWHTINRTESSSVCGSCVLKVPISSKFFIFPSDPTFHAMNICEKKIDLDKKRFCYECLKTWKSYNFSCSRPVPLITASTCSELWRRFRNMRL